MAHPLHKIVAVAARGLPWMVVLMSGCVVPVPAETSFDLDGGVNGYPVVKDSKPSMPGPISIDPNKNQTLTVTVSDSDRKDDLYIRVFKDYDKGNDGPIANFKVPGDPLGPEDRTQDMSTGGWCATTDRTSHQYDVVVADRDWDDGAASPTPRKVPFKPGRISTRSWIGQCGSSP